MSKSNGRLIGLSFFIFIIMLGCGLHSFAAENNCTRHNYVAIETHEPTCKAEGGTTYQCTECSHTFIGDVKEKLAHTWETVSETRPTCTASGSLIRRCKVCDTEETTVSGAATGHSFGDYALQAPTCSAEGYTYHICATCNEVEIVENSYTAKVPHPYEAQTITEPTCGQEGTVEYLCPICSDSYRESLPIVDHDLIAEVITPPTHTDTGYTTYVCRFCGLTTLDDITDPVDYDMDYTIEEPTCTEDGLKFGICRDGCLHTETVILPATGHQFSEGEDEGWVTVREASEALEGLEQRVCIHCGLSESRALPYHMPDPEPVRESSPELLICIGIALVLLVGIMVVVLLIILERTGHKNTRKYALLTAVDKALAEENQKQ